MDGDSPWPVWPVARCGKGRLYRSYLKLSDHCRGYGEVDEKSCVDGPRLAGEIVLRQTGCLRSCVRPLCAARIAAGPDGCSRAGTSSNPRVWYPWLLQVSPAPSVRPTAPSLSLLQVSPAD